MPEISRAPTPFSEFDLSVIGIALVFVLIVLGIRRIWSATHDSR